jgi:hypothetical protein
MVADNSRYKTTLKTKNTHHEKVITDLTGHNHCSIVVHAPVAPGVDAGPLAFLSPLFRKQLDDIRN